MANYPISIAPNLLEPKSTFFNQIVAAFLRLLPRRCSGNRILARLRIVLHASDILLLARHQACSRSTI